MKLKSTFSVAAFAAVTGLGASTLSAQVNMTWVTVGNAGNAADPTTGYGAVAYEYRIGAHEVTNAQYAAFLNSVAASDPNGLYNTAMGTDPRGGISRSGSAGSYTYSVRANMALMPVNFVSWFDAARMSNWMTNGQGSGSTESGAYTLTGPTTLGAITRNAAIPNHVFIPTENEWYKAAYHQPASQGGDADSYWLYATRSNTAPTVATANFVGDVSNPGQNVANYFGGADWNGINSNVTRVGSAGATSFYGAFDMNGNLWERSEGLVDGQCILRSGSFITPAADRLSSAYRQGISATAEDHTSGFRLASAVPGPGSAALLALSGLAAARRRRRH